MTAARQVQQGTWAGNTDSALKAPATATGTTQATALPVTTDYFELGTVASGSGVVLPTSAQVGALTPGDRFTVVNHGANAVLVYPPLGGKVANGAVNAALSLAAGKVGVYFVTSAALNQFAAQVSA